MCVLESIAFSLSLLYYLLLHFAIIVVPKSPTASMAFYPSLQPETVPNVHCQKRFQLLDSSSFTTSGVDETKEKQVSDSFLVVRVRLRRWELCLLESMIE